MTRRIGVGGLALLTALLLAGDALAAVPVNDAAELDRKIETNGATLQMKSVIFDQSKKRAGVKCAVTKGGRGSVENPSGAPDPGKGADAVRTYAPELPSSPEPSARGATLNEQTLGASSGKVVAGVDASQSTVGSTTSGYRARSGEVGGSETVMAAFDQNSSLRVQNGMTWNQAINAANLLVQSLNALNLAAQGDASQAAGAMPGLTPVIAAPRCGAGMIGTGTASDPCRPPECAASSGADGACVIRRSVDANGNVQVYLERIALAAQTSIDRAATGAITQSDVAAAVAARRASTP